MSKRGQDVDMPALARALVPQMETMAERIVQQVLHTVSVHSAPGGGELQRILVSAAQAAGRHFLAATQQVPGQGERVDEIFRRLGFAQAQSGYGREGIDAAHRAAVRWSGQYLAEFAIEHEMSSTQLQALFAAVYDYLDHLRDRLDEGFDLERRMGGQKPARAHLFDLFLADPMPTAVTTSSPPVVGRELLDALAETAGWPVPEQVVALAVSYYGEPPSVPDSPEILVRVEPRLVFVVCPATAQETLVEQISRSGPGLRIAVSWPVATAQAGTALSWCRRALDLVGLGVIPPTPVVRCSEHATQLWLHADTAMRRQLTRELLRPLLSETPRSRIVLSETLLAWVETRGSAPVIAARSNAHPQTIRYRWKRVNELFGESLQDPEFVIQMILVLKCSVPIWKAGDHSDFDSMEPAS